MQKGNIGVTTENIFPVIKKFLYSDHEIFLRVAAYCRVSTDDIDQAISIHLQIQEYKKKILANPNWKYVGTYVDDGFSGTNTEHRQGFQKLMKDAMDGKIEIKTAKLIQFDFSSAATF